jgi:broad specificity phosphatase PhoE
MGRPAKWPTQLMLIRHGESAYNQLKKEKETDRDYQWFVAEYARDFRSDHARGLAQAIRTKHALAVSDYDTPLTELGFRQAVITGAALMKTRELPDVVYVSPYKRTVATYGGLICGWPALGDVPKIFDDRIREQEHGLALLYNDWKVFHVFHPDQKDLYDLLGEYWYQWPQGESVSQVRDRIRSFQTMLVRECAGKRVMVVTHHLTILSVRANLERLTPEQFLYINDHEKPVNCGVTTYQCDPCQGKAGRLELKDYNVKYY